MSPELQTPTKTKPLFWVTWLKLVIESQIKADYWSDRTYRYAFVAEWESVGNNRPQNKQTNKTKNTCFNHSLSSAVSCEGVIVWWWCDEGYLLSLGDCVWGFSPQKACWWSRVGKKKQAVMGRTKREATIPKWIPLKKESILLSSQNQKVSTGFKLSSTFQ